MPYFKNDKTNILFIHIPKTGGSAVESYLSRRYNIKLNKSRLFYFDKTFSHVSLQHQTLSTILQNHSRFNIQLSDLMIFTVVRNPYTRIISDLFWNNIINGTESPAIITRRITSYLQCFKRNQTAKDNHIRPQYQFLIANGQIDPSVKILRQETLASDMNALGFNNFPMKQESSSNYFDLLTFEAVTLINTVYRQDFLHFGYDMITSNEILQTQQTRNTPQRPVPRPVQNAVKKQQPRNLRGIFFPGA
uniref:Sulfotransferase domain-containing protein n=1 Tax=viral metagenome TaxID=1070528 RepID=A0A6C0E533_9ZZZZ